MNKSQSIADFILSQNMGSFSAPAVEKAFKSLNPGLASMINLADVHNAFQKIRRGYKPKSEQQKQLSQRRLRRNPLVTGDFIDFAVYIAASGDRFADSEKTRIIELLCAKWGLGKN